MLSKIPWEIIGPAGALAIIILLIVFGFLVKFQKKNLAPAIPKDLNTISKKTLCFQHEGKIAANSKAVEMIGQQLNTVHENNRDDHGKIERKIDDLGGKIIQAINENSVSD